MQQIYKRDSSNDKKLTKSHNLDLKRKQNNQSEERTPQGYIIALACGPLKKQRYINNKIEEELKDFKKEIEGKF